ncbi:hypothetical protein BLGI_4707 [Brevibacillus laterosporus GI-9]|nr:hypothetical protein BLGI_4707 [Brevibacillus laterosporus GI-9]
MKLSEMTNINAGHLCGFLKEERDLTVDQLDSRLGKSLARLLDSYMAV